MGHCHSNIAAYESDHFTKTKNIVKLIQSPFKTKSAKRNRDHFFINYLHSKTKTKDDAIDPMRLNHLDHRRAVFVSVLGLYLTWKQCPCYMLYTALFMMPLKREWIHNISKYQQESDCNVMSDLSPFSDIERTKEFIELLKWKDSQRLVFWMLDEYQSPPDAPSQMVHPFWYHLSDKLTNLYDPITGAKYKPLNLNMNTWKKDTIAMRSKYGATFISMMNELYFLRMEHRGLQEIIYASNPESLRPMTSFTAHEIDDTINELYDEFDDDDDTDNWWISNEYDPYQLGQ